jgi:hypothetical protein
MSLGYTLQPASHITTQTVVTFVFMPFVDVNVLGENVLAVSK